jgi:hypothetical protein
VNGAVNFGGSNILALYCNNSASNGLAFNASYTIQTSIYASADIVASTVWARSDRRIKTNIQDIEDPVALDELRKIQPKLFNYIDVVQRGSSPVYGFIAQEVEQVIPYAVSKHPEHIPSIYELADVSGTLVTLKTKSTTLFGADENGRDASGNTIKVQFYDTIGKELDRKLVKIIDDKTFEVDEAFSVGGAVENQIFVYGPEVHDFRTIEKDAIFTIAVAALQQIDREYQVTKQEVVELKIQLACVLERLAASGIA